MSLGKGLRGIKEEQRPMWLKNCFTKDFWDRKKNRGTGSPQIPRSHYKDLVLETEWGEYLPSQYGEMLSLDVNFTRTALVVMLRTDSGEARVAPGVHLEVHCYHTAHPQVMAEAYWKLLVLCSECARVCVCVRVVLILYIGVLSACMFMHNVQVWCLQRSEKGFA